MTDGELEGMVGGIEARGDGFDSWPRLCLLDVRGGLENIQSRRKTCV